MEDLLAHSITYRIAVGPRAGRRVFTLQRLPAGDDTCSALAGRAAGLSLHAGVAARAIRVFLGSRLDRGTREYFGNPAGPEDGRRYVP